MSDLDDRLSSLAGRLGTEPAESLGDLQRRVVRIRRRRRVQRAGVVGMVGLLAVSLAVVLVNQRTHAGSVTATSSPSSSSTVDIAVSERAARPQFALDVGWGEEPGRLTYEPGNQSANTAPNSFAVDESQDLLLVLDSASRRVVAYHLHDRSLASEVDVGTSTAGDLVYDPATRLAYIFDADNGTLITLDVRPQLRVLSRVVVWPGHSPSAQLVLDGPRRLLWVDNGGRLAPIADLATSSQSPPTPSNATQAPTIGLRDGRVTVERPPDATIELSFDEPAVLAYQPMFDYDGTYWLYVLVGTYDLNRPLIVHVDPKRGTAVGLAQSARVINDSVGHTYAIATQSSATGQPGDQAHVYAMTSDEHRFQIERFLASADTAPAAPVMQIVTKAAVVDVGSGRADVTATLSPPQPQPTSQDFVRTPYGIVGAFGPESAANLVLVDPGTGQVRTLAGPVTSFALSPDGHRIAWDEPHVDATFRILSTTAHEANFPQLDGEVHTEISDSAGVVGFAGTSVLMNLGDGATSRGALWTPDGSFSELSSTDGIFFAGLPDGHAVLSDGDSGCASLVRIDDGPQTHPPHGPLYPDRQELDCRGGRAVVSADGTLIVRAGRAGDGQPPTIALYRADGSQVTTAPVPNNANVGRITWVDDNHFALVMQTPPDWQVYVCDRHAACQLSGVVTAPADYAGQTSAVPVAD